MSVRLMTDLDLAGRRVLLREDLNVPLREGEVANDARIRAALPTICHAARAGARVAVISHLGRPVEGRFDPELSLAPVARRMAALLERDVPLIADWLDGIALQDGEVALCENVRFNRGENDDDPSLARRMASTCDVFVMDAFATAHRAQASTHGVARYAPIACAGPLLAAELDALSRALRDPARPLVAIVGGAKVSTKLGVLESLSGLVDRLIVGGGIANTFIAAAGHEIGQSLSEPSLVPVARRLLASAAERDAPIPIPVDVVVGPELADDAPAAVKPVDAVTSTDRILDIGPQTGRHYAELLQSAGTIVWNGPVGAFEYPPFAAGTRAIAEAVAASAAFSIAGGGDTLAAIDQFGVAERIGYASTGGGAFLEFLEGKKLPALAVLEERASLADRPGSAS